MVRLSKRRKRFINGLATAIIVGLAFCLVFHFNLLHGIHLQSSDFLYRADSNQRAEPDNKIVIVAIDDKSLEQLGRLSSWPRSYHAQLINTLAENGARIIAFDVLFSEPAPDDDELVASMKQAGNIILPLAGNLEARRSATTGEALALENALRPLPSYEASALAVGHANMMPDEDGIVRRLPLIIPNGDHYEPALSLSAVAKYLRRPQIIESLPRDNLLSFAGRSVPLDNANSMLINYKGGSASPSNFATVSYVDVLKNNISPDTFQDRIVLIGATAVGLGDTFWTPMGQMTSGVVLHASAMDTILAGNFIKPSPAVITMLSILLFAFLCGLAVLRLRVLWATLSAVFLGLIYFLTAFYFFDHGTVLDMLYPPLTIAGTFMGITLYNVTLERLEKSEITRTFGRYVSPSIAKMILDAINEGSLKLGGEERTVTILFADVRNFTGISERMNTQQLVSILNRYLSEIIKATLRYGGMVNKFGGDSIMAIWNVPIACPEHALLATRAALRAQQALKELPERAQNLPRMEFGIGVNTGKAVAGNMGSLDRLEYSVIGDAVNTAARLAGVTPGGKVWIGAGTYDLIESDVCVTPLEPLSLKGKHEAIRAYEVLAIQNRPAEELEKTINLIGEGQGVTNHGSCV
jgi:adenylate cyclase